MKIFNKRGVSSIAALLTLLSLAAMGVVIAYLVASGETSRANHLLSSRAFYVTQAGIEWAIKRIYDGQNEIVSAPGQAFGPGTFTVSRVGRTLTVTGTVGNAVRLQKVDSPTEADCTSIDVSNVNLVSNNKTIKNIYFHKICLTSITIDKMQFTWVTNGGEKLKKIKIESSTVYDNPSGSSSGTLLDTADYTVVNGNNNVFNNIDFSASMEEKTVTMTWTMGDTSTKTVTFQTED